MTVVYLDSAVIDAATDFLDDEHMDATPCSRKAGYVGTTKASGGRGCIRKKQRDKAIAKMQKLKEQKRGSGSKKSAGKAALAAGNKKARTELKKRQTASKRRKATRTRTPEIPLSR